jgi:mannose-6-phosphate isomerase-like protein (cupin superfamily)
VKANPRHGVPMYVHHNEDEHEHFIVVQGTMRLVNGDRLWDVPVDTAA